MPSSAQPHGGEWALRRKRAGPARPRARPGTYQREVVSGQCRQAVAIGPAACFVLVATQAPPVLRLPEEVSAGLAVHVGEVDGVGLLQRLWPVAGEAFWYEPDGAVEGEAGVAARFAGCDVEVTEPKSGEPYQGPNERRVRGGAFAEPEVDGQLGGGGDLPVRAYGVGGEVGKGAGGGGADDREPPAGPVGVVHGDVAGFGVWPIGESGGDLFDVHVGLRDGLLGASEG